MFFAGGGGGHSARKKAGHVLTVLLTLILTAGLTSFIFTQRRAIYDRFPVVEDVVGGVEERVRGVMGWRPAYRYGERIFLLFFSV